MCCIVVALVWKRRRDQRETDHLDLKETVAVGMNADASEPAPKEAGVGVEEPEWNDAHADAI